MTTLPSSIQIDTGSRCLVLEYLTPHRAIVSYEGEVVIVDYDAADGWRLTAIPANQNETNRIKKYLTADSVTVTDNIPAAVKDAALDDDP